MFESELPDQRIPHRLKLQLENSSGGPGSGGRTAVGAGFFDNGKESTIDTGALQDPRSGSISSNASFVQSFIGNFAP